MNMGQAISSCFSKYATFSGRASRSEYWYFYLFYAIIYFALSLVDPTGNGVIGGVVALGFILPLWASGVRRAHDAGKSGWFLLIPIYNLVILCTPTTVDNQYGPAA